MSASKKQVPDIFSYLILITAHVNIEMTFCGKLNRGGHDQNVRIYFIYKFAIAYKRAEISFY